jgi:hypothetical protein
LIAFKHRLTSLLEGCERAVDRSSNQAARRPVTGKLGETITRIDVGGFAGETAATLSLFSMSGGGTS